MNKEFKERWVSALRSGKYSQGHRNLCRDDLGKKQYCCLGVALDIKNTGIWKRSSDFIYAFDFILQSSFRIPAGACPAALSSELGITTDEMRNLARMNDSGYSFDVIADYIENNIKTDP